LVYAEEFSVAIIGLLTVKSCQINRKRLLGVVSPGGGSVQWWNLQILSPRRKQHVGRPTFSSLSMILC